MVIRVQTFADAREVAEYLMAQIPVLLDLSSATSTPIFPGDFFGSDNALCLAGGYLFTAEVNNNNDGRINIYDISTPSTPRAVGQKALAGFGGYAFSGLVALGTDYLIGISPNTPFGAGHDVMVIDRRDVNNLRKITDIDIPNFNAFRGTIVGNLLYVTGVQSGVAVVDLTNPAAPVIIGTYTSAGAARHIDVAGATLAVANGSNGISFLDVSTPSLPRLIASQPVPGSAWSVALSRGAMYVATELGLTAIGKVATPPILNELLLTVTATATTATVQGAADALTGITPITVVVKNNTTAATSTPTYTR